MMETRREQLRRAKQRQRTRDERDGFGVYQVKLPHTELHRLKAGMRKTDFRKQFSEFLNRELIPLDQYPTLELLCWNRRDEYLTRREAFDLYESNWRLVDENALDDAERELLTELADEFGHGVINA